MISALTSALCALTSALHVHNGVTFRLGLTVVVNIQNDNNVNAIQQQKQSVFIEKCRLFSFQLS